MRSRVEKNGAARVSLLGVDLDRLRFDEFVDRVAERIERARGEYVVTPNVDHFMHLERDDELRRIYRHASFVVPDGMPLVWATRWLGTALPERITGADLFPRICALAAERGYSVFLVGATDEVCRRTRDKLERMYPALRVAGWHSPPHGFESRRDQRARMVRSIHASTPDIVFVGLGAPRQEKLIWYLRQRVRARLFLGVGAALEYYAGVKRRAPVWAQRAGLEWAFRLCAEPRRLWKRYLVDDPRFFWWVLKAKLRPNS